MSAGGPSLCAVGDAVLRDARIKLAQIRDDPRFELLLPSEADEVLRALDRYESRLARIANETLEHPGLGLLHHIAIGTHDGAINRV